jgi:hypothetical protein
VPLVHLAQTGNASGFLAAADGELERHIQSSSKVALSYGGGPLRSIFRNSVCASNSHSGGTVWWLHPRCRDYE